jgi:hypothetical protein
MRLHDMLREGDLVEFMGPGGDPGTAPVAPTTAAAPGGAMPATSNDPKIQGAMLAQQQKQKQTQRKAIQDQITALTKQLSDLRRQLSTVR